MPTPAASAAAFSAGAPPSTRHAGAFQLWKKVYPVMDLLLTTAFIPGIKAGLKLQGLDAGVPRLPMLPYSDEETARLAALLDALK